MRLEVFVIVLLSTNFFANKFFFCKQILNEVQVLYFVVVENVKFYLRILIFCQGGLVKVISFRQCKMPII